MGTFIIIILRDFKIFKYYNYILFWLHSNKLNLRFYKKLLYFLI